MRHTLHTRFAAALAALALLVSLASPRMAYAAWRDPVRAPKGMVASSHPLATQVGVEVLRRGGNAVDAAVAVGLALAVVLPWAGNVGGGGFMVIRMADGRTAAIDYREMAPAAAHRDMYLDAAGNLIPDLSVVGYRAAGVPGTPAGLELARAKYGSMAWRDLIAPAVRLARDGFTVDAREARRLAGDPGKRLRLFDDSRRIFLRGGDAPYREGEILRQPDLAATLERMQKGGAREFYEGETARRIAADMKAHDGLITEADLRGYVAKEREPLRGRYRGYEIVTMPPPSSGGIALLQMLGMLERFDVAAAGFGSAATVHLEVEAMRRAFADRAEFLGDADFVRVPVPGLLAPSYVAARGATIDPARASSSADVGAGAPAPPESEQTTHFSVVDAAGNIVSNTYTLNDYYGSGVVAAGTGVLLNDEMDDFAAKPGTANMFGLIQKENNAVAPRKRPLSSMTPTIVLSGGRPWFAVGSPGGPTIINTVFQSIVNVVDFKMNIQEAIDAPRVHHQWMPDEILAEPFGLPREVADALRARGHRFAEASRAIGDAQAVAIDLASGVRLGAYDARAGGLAAGY